MNGNVANESPFYIMDEQGKQYLYIFSAYDNSQLLVFICKPPITGMTAILKGMGVLGGRLFLDSFFFGGTKKNEYEGV